MIARRAKLCSMLLALVLGGDAATALAAPTPVPGGANQLAGVSGTFSQVLFNGTLRLKGMTLKDAVPADNVRPNAPGERALVFRAIVNNGTHHADHGYFDATLSDADGITVTGRPLNDGWSLEPGAAARVVNGFSVPAGFVPTKLLLVYAAHPKTRAFRITIRPSDLPAAPGAPGAPGAPPPAPTAAP
ncbi:MAG: hypothetical protein JWO66_2582 [Candidatus Eremiobacteraeota bacterium]|jgi:hypothetical protein|nr:hypothetical protein [Candidatus Eremiobacteraeota bacterium]